MHFIQECQNYLSLFSWESKSQRVWESKKEMRESVFKYHDKILSKFRVSPWKKRTLEVKGMNVVNINVEFLFCCLEMTSLQWINIFFLGLGDPQERAWCVFLCKYTEFDPKSAESVRVNQNQNESNGNFSFSWEWDNNLSWAGSLGRVTGTSSARTTTAERFVCAC